MPPAPKPPSRVRAPSVLSAMHQLIHCCEYDTFPRSHRMLEVHHIQSRGTGGSDHPNNLIMLCRHHHDEAGRKRLAPETLAAIARERAATPIGAELLRIFHAGLALVAERPYSPAGATDEPTP